jgi:hypothetical protein
MWHRASSLPATRAPVLWTSHDPTVSTTDVASNPLPSQNPGVGTGVTWDGTVNSLGLGQIASSIGPMLPLIGPVSFDAGFSTAGAGAALWQGVDAVGMTQGGLPASGIAALHGSTPDAISFAGAATALGLWTTNNQHLMIGVG